MSSTSIFYKFAYFVLFVVFLLQSIFYPNFILSEEHHYLEVASNLFYHSHKWMLEDSMGVYLSKPPLLFWMLTGLWKIFGAHNWVIHFLLMSILAGIFFCSQYLYRILFNDAEQAQLVPVIILGSFLFFSRSTVFCFDSLVVLFFVLSAIGIVWALKHKYMQGFVLYGFSIGLGVLAKGPIILVFCLPFFVVATFLRHEYSVQDRAWFLGFFLSILIVLVLVMMWLIPMLHQLSSVRQHMLLWHRGFGVGDTYGHVPFYFYIKTCLLLFLPWLLWPYGVRSLVYSVKKNRDVGFKLVFYSLLLSLVVLSIIPPKALRYVMSSMVLFALLYVYALYQNKAVFYNGTRGALIVLTSIGVAVGMITLFFPQWVMAKINYPAITYFWVLMFESVIVVAGIVLICFKKRTFQFEAMRLCGFTCMLVMCAFVLPHEVMSKNFDYVSFVTFLNDAKNKNISIVYCRAYGGYQYSMTTPLLPQEKYKLTKKEGAQSNFVYFVEVVKKTEPAQKNYLYRLLYPSQTGAIFVRKMLASEFVGLSFKQQRCLVNIKQL
ncbi:MAG: glycosyltransferase family 39 protein [Pseudomonadota bacterium]